MSLVVTFHQVTSSTETLAKIQAAHEDDTDKFAIVVRNWSQEVLSEGALTAEDIDPAWIDFAKGQVNVIAAHILNHLMNCRDTGSTPHPLAGEMTSWLGTLGAKTALTTNLCALASVTDLRVRDLFLGQAAALIKQMEANMALSLVTEGLEAQNSELMTLLETEIDRLELERQRAKQDLDARLSSIKETHEAERGILHVRVDELSDKADCLEGDLKASEERVSQLDQQVQGLQAALRREQQRVAELARRKPKKSGCIVM